MTVATGLDLVCPACRADLIDEACAGCGRSFPPVAGLHDLRLASDRYLDLPAERAKADRLAKIAETTDLAGAARAYYAMTEDVDPPRRRPASRPERSAEPRRRRGDNDGEDAALPAWVEPEALEDEGHYEPPPPPPVPRPAPRKLAAVAGMLLGLALLLRPSLVGPFQLSPAGIFLVGLTLVLGGAATLVLLMRDAPPTDSGPDDGAVV